MFIADGNDSIGRKTRYKKENNLRIDIIGRVKGKGKPRLQIGGLGDFFR